MRKKLRIKIKINFLSWEKRAVVLLSIAIFIIANILSSRIPLQFDFSKNKFFTLSSSTKKILKKVDDVLKVKFFVSSNLPRRLLPLKNMVWSFLKEYKRENSNIEVYLLSPDKDPKAADEAKAAGLPELQFSELAREKFAVSKGYFGVVVAYSGKREVIPQAANFEDLEYELTTAIYRLTNKKLPKVAVLGYENPFGKRDSEIFSFNQLMTKQFELSYIKPQDLNEQNYNLMILFDDGKTKYATEEVKAIESYLKKGGKGIFLVNGVWISENLSYNLADHNLFSIFEKRGMKLNKNLVLSGASELVTFGNNLFSYLVPYPFWVKTNVFNSKANYSSNISFLTFPWASSIELKKTDGYKTDWLVKTTKESWIQQSAFTLLPDKIIPPESGFKPYILAAISKKGKEEVVLISSNRFALERFLRRNNNLDFLLNLSVSLSSEGALSNIKIKKANFYFIPPLSVQVKEGLKYGSIFLLPIVYFAFGVIRVIKRK